MHVLTNRSALLEVLNIAAGIAASRTTKDILKCVRLTAADGKLLVSATDLEVALRAEITQVEASEPGDLLVPADKLLQIMRESMDETLAIEGDGQVCHIRGQDSHFEIYGQDPHEFPPVADLEGPVDIELEGAVLQGLIEKTLFAVARENTRYAINGVLWEKRAKGLSLVATDGRRLARAVGVLTKSTGDESRPIVPARMMHTLQRILATEEGLVAVQFTANQVIVRAGRYVVSSALAEGHFPQYEEIIPADNDKRAELGTEGLLSAVRRAALLTNDQSKGIRLAFTEGKLVLSSRAPEQGEATISITAEYSAEPLEIGFNPAFLAEALRVVGTPTIQVDLKEGNRPGVFRAGSDFLYVVMPVNLA